MHRSSNLPRRAVDHSPFNRCPFLVISTGANPDFLPRDPGQAACAPFSKERRMLFASATNFHRKSGGAQRRDLCVDASSWECFSTERSTSADLSWKCFFKSAKNSAGSNRNSKYCSRSPRPCFPADAKVTSTPGLRQTLPTSYSDRPHPQTSAYRSSSACGILAEHRRKTPAPTRYA